jgi:hypothetical protein
MDDLNIHYCNLHRHVFSKSHLIWIFIYLLLITSTDNWSGYVRCMVSTAVHLLDPSELPASIWKVPTVPLIQYNVLFTNVQNKNRSFCSETLYTFSTFGTQYVDFFILNALIVVFIEIFRVGHLPIQWIYC